MICSFRLSAPIITLTLLIGAACSSANRAADKVTVDFEMAEVAIDWLEHLKTGWSDDVLRAHFFEHVAPTEGCQVIVRHWARFMEWDEEIFYNFILEALGKKETDKPLQNEDGTPTALGHSRALWINALQNTEKLWENFQALRKADLEKASIKLAKRYLPKGADVTNTFHIVLFGGSPAFSVGDANGYDLLQLPVLEDGTLNMERILLTLAHEMHHSGFANASTLHMSDVENEENISLVGILAAEGMATWLINQPLDHLEEYRTGTDPIYRLMAQDWDRLLPQIPELYKNAETDIRLNLIGELEQQELQQRWMSGYQGAAYILGCDMIATIEEHLGLKATRSIANDYRQLLNIYNRAAMRANKHGADKFVFNEALAVDIASHR